MNKSKVLKIVAVILMFIAVVVIAFTVNNGDAEAASRYVGTIATIAPPIIAILLALITKEVYSSLFIGITIAALFATNFNAV